MSKNFTLKALADFDFDKVSMEDKIEFLQAVGRILKNGALDKKLKIDEFLASMGLNLASPEVRESSFIEVYSSIFNLEEIISLATIVNTPMTSLIEVSKLNTNMTVAQAFVETLKKGA